MSKKEVKSVFNLAYISGQYPDNGEMKNSYHSVGTAFLKEPEENKQVLFIKLDSYPPIGKTIYAFEKLEGDNQSKLDLSNNKVFNICTPNGTYATIENEKNITKTSYHKVGTAFLNERGLSFRLLSLPIPNQKSEVWLYLFENSKKQESNNLEVNTSIQENNDIIPNV